MKKLLYLLDRGAARLLGAPDHTLSGYAYQLSQAGSARGLWWVPRIDGFFLIWKGQAERDHCRRAFDKETAAKGLA